MFHTMDKSGKSVTIYSAGSEVVLSIRESSRGVWRDVHLSPRAALDLADALHVRAQTAARINPYSLLSK